MARTLKSIEYIKDKVGKIFIMSNSITHNETSLEDILNRQKLYMVSGTMTKVVNSTSCMVHTWEQIQDLFQNLYGFAPSSFTEMGVIFTNGDANANGFHCEGSSWVGTNAYAVFDRNVSGQIRINYAYFYNN